MLAITIADLRFRLRQFLIAVVGAGVVFAMALLLTGMVNGFHNEIDRTVASADAEAWVLQDGTSGPFTSVTGMPESTVAKVRRSPGIESATGLVISLQTADRGQSGLRRVMMIGVPPGGAAQVEPDEGRQVRTPREAVVDRRLGVDLTETFTVAGRRFTVVGLVEGLTMLGGTPDIWVGLRSAQELLFRGQRLVTTVVVTGTPQKLPKGLIAMSNPRVEDDSFGPMRDAVDSINNTRFLMWLVATIIVAALVYVSALQRTRDFAVMKAVGASSRLLFLGLALQAVVVTLAAAVLAEFASWVMRPLITVPVEVPFSAYLWLPIVAVAVGLLSSLVALRRAINVDPALAFGAG